MKKKLKNYVIVFAAVVALLVVGYATFAQPLAHRLPTVTGNEWNIGFVDAVRSDVKGNAKEMSAVTYNSTSASFNIFLSGAGDSITYDFTIKNKGALTAKVDSIYVVPTNKPNDAILFNTSGLQVGDELKSLEEAHLKVTASYSTSSLEDLNTASKSVTVIVNYKQK